MDGTLTTVAFDQEDTNAVTNDQQQRGPLRRSDTFVHAIPGFDAGPAYAKTAITFAPPEDEDAMIEDRVEASRHATTQVSPIKLGTPDGSTVPPAVLEQQHRGLELQVVRSAVVKQDQALADL